MPDPPTDQPVAAASRKRRHSALDLLTIYPTPAAQMKRPRIIIVNDSKDTKPSHEFPQSSGTTIETAESSRIDDRYSSDSSTISSTISSNSTANRSSCNPGHLGNSIRRLNPLGHENDGNSSTSSSSSSSESTSEEEMPYSTPTPGGEISAVRSPENESSAPTSTPSSGSVLRSGNPLQARIESFLPQLNAANQLLVAAHEAGTLSEHCIELLDGDEENGAPNVHRRESPSQSTYIEMSLGLGVLEEQPRRDLSDEDTSSSSSESSVAEDHNVLLQSGGKSNKSPKDTHILRHLMGQEKAERPNIHVVEEA